MQRRPLEQAWTMALTIVAATATALALYVHFFELGPSEQEARMAASRMESALAASRERLKAEIMAELRAELAGSGAAAGAGAETPIPGAVLRRPEEDEGTGGLRQAIDPSSLWPALTLAGLNQSLESVARQADASDQALRGDLEALRHEIRGELQAAEQVTSLSLVALVPLVGHLLYASWRGLAQARHREGDGPGDLE